MRITIETSSWRDIQRIVAMLKSLDISDFNIVGTKEMETAVSKGDKSTFSSGPITFPNLVTWF